jgi:hypothetical protein
MEAEIRTASFSAASSNINAAWLGQIRFRGWRGIGSERSWLERGI